MKRPYELTYIVRIDTSNEGLDGQIQQVQSWITEGQQGRILREEVWGRRKLAYEIEHQSEGFYIHYLAAIETSVLPELEQNLKLAPDVLRYLIVRVEESEIDPALLAEPAETETTKTAVEGTSTEEASAEAITPEEATAADAAPNAGDTPPTEAETAANAADVVDEASTADATDATAEDAEATTREEAAPEEGKDDD
ncbi:MAG: 30S ribosomal protein S6 [Anaerolineaceae bacterium]|nr:30S ribosomal protein S6 [Anaerolineaceae bacterium]